jgi:hypothetical protein
MKKVSSLIAKKLAAVSGGSILKEWFGKPQAVKK